MACCDMRNAVLTDHARLEMRRRGITESEVRTILAKPEQRTEVRPGRCVCQGPQIFGEPPRVYLLRVFMDVDRVPPEVVTAYRTSKVEKYWRGQCA